MIKKFSLIALILLMPALASAVNMQVTSSALPATGGSISPNGIKFFAAAATYTIAVNPGWAVSAVLIDGANSPNGLALTQTVPYDTTKTHTIKVTFTQGTYSITTSAGTGGSVLVTGGGNTSILPGSNRDVIVAPATGYKITSIIADGSPVSPGLYDPIYSYTVSFTNIQANHTVSATFDVIPSLVPYAGTNQTVTASGSAPWSITLAGSASSNVSGITYQWNLVEAPANATASFSSPTSASTQLSVNTVGSYKVTLTAFAGGVSATSAPVTVSVVTPGFIASDPCRTCHAGQLQVNQWLASPHGPPSLTGASCVDCHLRNGNTDQHSFPALADAVSSCNGCHLDNTGNVPQHPVAINGNICISCHNPHSLYANITSAQAPHFNNITSVGYPASYMTSRASCSNCHYTTANNSANRHEWAVSGHANVNGFPWMGYDFKTKDGCVQCHTTTGFIAYSTGKKTTAWGVASDKTKEVLTCIGCHSDVANGIIRSIAPLRPYADNPGYTNPDLGNSNICASCHSGMKSGMSITARLANNADFTNMPFIDPHGLAAGGTLFNIAGYRFPGSSFSSYSSNTHKMVGIANTGNTGTNGPCITCHKNPVFSHTFLSTASVAVCANCHSASFTDAQLAASQSAFITALEVLRVQLAAKGYPYSSAPPYFSATNWGTGQAGANTMGAAFNYRLLIQEPGAFVHNSAYAKQLIIDSIDYLYNGRITGSIDTALSSLVASGAISQAAAQSVSAYKAGSSCVDCHGGTASSSSPMASNAHQVHLTGAFGPGNYLGSDVAACQACHIYSTSQPNPTHMNGVVNVLNGAGSACAGCHPGTLPAWNSTALIACTDCHAATPSRLPNGVAAPYKANFSAAGHGQFAASSQCTACHNPLSPHISSVPGLNNRLFLPNDNSLCGSCHNNTTAPQMSSHVLDKNATPTQSYCSSCHDPHGTTNAFMIKTTINNVAVSFTNNSTGFIQTTAPYQGLCQVCHTLTNHYRAGQSPDGHPTRNCLSCHSHQGPFAFAPVGYCDSCHGYPPAPAGFVGRQGNYSSARYENYTGGAGAHLIAAHVDPKARPSEGWANCTGCHGNGSLSPATHTMKLPVTPSKITIDVANQLKFNASLPLGPAQYDGKLIDGANATGRCSNVACHFKLTRKWSTER